MKKYAKWKATDISKALKEGRTPVPGPPGGLSAEELELQEELRKIDGGASANLFPPSPVPPQQQQQQQQPVDDTFGFPSVPKSTPSQFNTRQQPQQPPMDDQFGFPSVPKSTPSQQNDSFGFPSVPKSNPPPPSQSNDSFGFPSVPKSNPPPPSQPNDQFGFPNVPKTTSFAPKPAPAAAPAPAPVVSQAPASVAPQVPKGFTANIEGAQKNCKFAASALNFDDTNTAIKHLLKALQDLTGREYIPK